MLTNKQVAEFQGLSLGGFKHWSAEQRRRARIEAEVDATAAIQKHIAELNRLAYVFDCKHVNGLDQVMECRINRNTWRSLSVSIYRGVVEINTITISLQSIDTLPRLINARAFLQGLIYGAQANGQE